MTYEHIVAGTSIDRPGRFITHIKTGSRIVVCHVKNTGWCRELLIPGAVIILELHPDVAASGRKTEYDPIGVYKNDLLINTDSQVPNEITWGWLTSPDGSMDSRGCMGKTGSLFSPLGLYVLCDIRREVTYGDPRLDLAFPPRDRDAKAVPPVFMEVKDATLEENDMAMLPSASTERGIKHLEGFIRAHEESYEAYILSVIQMKGIRDSTPNDMTHLASGDILRQTREAGVHVLTYGCLVTSDTVIVNSPVKVTLDQNMSQYTLLTLRVGTSLWEAPAVSAFILSNMTLKLRVF